MKKPLRKDLVDNLLLKAQTPYNQDMYYEAYTYYKATLLYYILLESADLSGVLQDLQDKGVSNMSNSDYIK